MDEERAERNKPSRLGKGIAELGPEVAGSVVGAGVGLAAAGPGGAVAAAVMGPLVARAGEAAREFVRGRQQRRVDAAIESVGDDIARRADDGELIRSDGFFDPRPDTASEGDELFEGVLIEAANAYQERKVPFLGRLFSGIAHDETLSPASANFLIKLVGQLTYGQLVALSAFAHAEDVDSVLDAAFQDGGQVDPALVAELDDLGIRQLIGVDHGAVVAPMGTTIGGLGTVSSVGSRAPREDGESAPKMRLTDAGRLVVRLARIDELDPVERDAWVRALQGRD